MQSSSKQNWGVARISDVQRSYRPTWLEFGVFANQPIELVAASFESAKHAERLCSMLNDTYTSCLPGPLESIPIVDTKRLVNTMKLFCLQENLTWFDLGFDEDEIRHANEILETQMDLAQTAQAK